MINILNCLKKKENIIKIIALLFSAILVVADQVIKNIAVNSLKPIETKPIINDFFHLTYVENSGAAFNILDGKGIFLVIFTVLIILGLIYLVISNKFNSVLITASLSLFIGGGIGNLIDRIFRHYVIDYLDFRIIHFAVFNFADCCVVIGAILLIISIFIPKKAKNIEENNDDKVTESVADKTDE